ncbi:MAG: outer membrane protein assembly factor BamE [Acetobacteraceae bacterium]|nr:outer membrane protein assembly factor BamE [Acetobacteraceae bacterium]
MLLTAAACSSRSGDKAILDPGKVSAVHVGRSSRSDVLALLGRPSRTEWNTAGETWVYQVREENLSRQELASGATVAGTVLGAFVPFGGLVGTGLGLAGTQVGGAGAEPVTTLTVAFGETGTVRDCTYSTTAFSAQPAPGTGAAAQPAFRCQGPAPKSTVGN